MPAMRPPCGISWQKRPNKTQRKVEWEADNPFTKPQTARASFHPPDRNQSRPAHQIASGTSYVSAHPSPKHLDREAAPAQPAFRTPGISHIATRPQAARRRHARQAASRIPNSMPTKPPMPLPPGLSHFPEKAAALFHVEGKTRERRRVRNASPRRKRSPPWSSKHLNAATATRFSTRNTPPRCCGPNAPTAEAEHIRTRPPHLPHAASPE